MKNIVKVGIALASVVIVAFAVRTAYDLVDNPVVWHEVEPEV